MDLVLVRRGKKLENMVIWTEVGRVKDLELYPHYGIWYGKTDVWVVMDVERKGSC